MDEKDVERVLTELLTGYAGEPVTVGDYTIVDGTECGYLLRVFFQTRPLAWEVGCVDVTYTDAGQRAVMCLGSRRSFERRRKATPPPGAGNRTRPTQRRFLSRPSGAAIAPSADPECFGIGAQALWIAGLLTPFARAKARGLRTRGEADAEP